MLTRYAEQDGGRGPGSGSRSGFWDAPKARGPETYSVQSHGLLQRKVNIHGPVSGGLMWGRSATPADVHCHSGTPCCTQRNDKRLWNELGSMVSQPVQREAMCRSTRTTLDVGGEFGIHRVRQGQILYCKTKDNYITKQIF